MTARIQTVDDMVKAIVAREGGYVDHPNDPGGPTKHGVSLYRYAKGKPELDLDGDGDIDKRDIMLVTPALAEKLYKADFYYAPNFHMLADPIEPVVFDMAVNSGNNRAVKILQEALNLFGAKLAIDGRLGSKTWTASEEIVTRVGASALVNAYCDCRQAFYDWLVANNPGKFGPFKKGWRNRVNEFRQ